MKSGSASASAPIATLARASAVDSSDLRFVTEARFYRKLLQNKVKCELCSLGCTLSDQQRSPCGVRENRNGQLFTLVHSRVCTAHIDPIEKKPLFHYLPGSTAFSLAAAGCNVHCQFCQNWEISQSRPEDLPGEYAPPERIVELAARAKCPTIAYTYSEPTVWAEFAMDTADAAHRAGIRSIVISNGSMQAAAVREVYGRMDAIKIDLKSFSDSFYQKIVKGRLKPVLETIVTLREMNKWFEIVFLVIPTLNDSDAEFRDLARWIKNNAGPDIPLHFTQFHPAYKLKDLPVTPLATLERAHAIATGEGLRFVYIGNVAGHPAENTYCPECKQLLIERAGMAVAQWKMTDGACPQCQCSIPGIWS